MLAQNYQCDKAKTDRWAGREGVREELRHGKNHPMSVWNGAAG